MASPADINQRLPETLPDTLPEDFGDWDSESSPAAPASPSVLEAPAPFSAPAKPRDARPLSSAPISAEEVAFLKKQRQISGLMDRDFDSFIQKGKSSNGVTEKSSAPVAIRPEPSQGTKEAQPLAWRWPNVATVGGKQSAAEPMAAVSVEAPPALFGAIATDIDDAEEPQTDKKKWIIIAAVAACVVLLLIVFVIPMFRGAKTASKQPVQPPPVVADNQPIDSTPAPADQTPQVDSKPQAATPDKSQPAATQPAPQEAPKASPVQSDMMNSQLAAPTTIPRDNRKQVAENAPPSANLDASGALGGGDAMGAVFNGPGQPIVKAARTGPLAISAGVATGMLIRQTPPIYPSIAKTARVAGTVQLDATISKDGAIKDLHVISGPPMLRQAAVDAVKTWRYRPYKLNNDPIDIETTINVIFTLAR